MKDLLTTTLQVPKHTRDNSLLQLHSLKSLLSSFSTPSVQRCFQWLKSSRSSLQRTKDSGKQFKGETREKAFIQDTAFQNQPLHYKKNSKLSTLLQKFPAQVFTSSYQHSKLPLFDHTGILYVQNSVAYLYTCHHSSK